MSNSIHITILDYPNAMRSAVYGIIDIFTIANLHADKEIFTSEIITTLSGNLKKKGRILFIPPCLTSDFPTFNDAQMLEQLKQWHDENVIMVAACAAVFWLAESGLLDGKHVTTHWKLCQKLEDNYPKIKKVSVHNMVVDQGDIITAGGLYAFQDLTLHVITRFAGYALAKQVADYSLLDLNGRLQIFYQRFYPDYSHTDDAISKVQRYCDKHIASSLSVIELAKLVNMSERTLLRRFKKTLGLTPKQYILKLKIEKAKQIMELENISVEETGYQLGYLDNSNFVKAFKKVAGITPSEFKGRNG